MQNSCQTNAAAGSSGSKRLSVVICTRDRPDALLETCRSLWHQTRLPDELLIIDDGDLPVSIRDQLAANCEQRGVEFRCEHTVAPGLTRGRNLAARIAQGEVLLYLDDDVTCAPEAIGSILDCFAESSIAAVTARVDEPVFESLSGRLYQFGYRIAAWWRVRPRGRPPGPRPAILHDPETATVAQWLSGAAMALRREIVLANPFDETLIEYALGEDRELGYRLAPKHWIVEARKARIVHRRSPGQRTEGRRLGFMTGHNYVSILRKTCRLGAGEWFLLAWSMVVMSFMHLAWMAGPGRRNHFESLLGMVQGLFAALRGVGVPRRPEGIDAFEAGVHTQPPSLNRMHGGNRGCRVLFVTNRLENGGAERMLVALAVRLPQYQITPQILCLKDAGPLAGECRIAGIVVHEGLLRHKVDASVISRIQRIISENAIDVVVAAHSGGDRMFWSTLAGRLSEAPVVVWSHWFPLPGQHHFERANRALYRMVDAFVAIGWRHRLALIRNEHVPAGRITVIPNAIDLGRFINGPSREEARRRLRLTPSQIGVAIIANLRHEKRHDVFIAAAKRLAVSNPELRFFIIGDGPNRDSVLASAAASGLDHEILRLFGPRDDVPELLPGIDVSCLCSDQECFSVTMLEAAAAGCAFVGPDTGSLPEFLEQGRTGLVIKPADVDGLADAILRLTRDAALRARLVDAARRKVIANYGLDTMARDFADLFFSLRKRSTCGSNTRRKIGIRAAASRSSKVVAAPMKSGVS